MFGVEFVFQVFQFIDNLLGMLGAELVDITCTVIAERAFAPVTTARAKIGHEFFRRKIFFPRHTVKIRRRQFGNIFLIGVIDMHVAFFIFIDEVGDFRHFSFTC